MGVLTVLRAFVVAASMLADGAAAAGTQRPTLEPDVKAAFLYNFTRFVEWPSAANPSQPFRLCVVATDDVLRHAIERTVAGEQVGGRRLVVVEPALRELSACQIVFVGRNAGAGLQRILAAVRDQPVLTVSDAAGFVEQGGVIGFVLENNRVRFDVNVASAERARLKISANLLRVAKSIVERRP